MWILDRIIDMARKSNYAKMYNERIIQRNDQRIEKAEAREEGRNEGRIEGRNEGIELGKLETARNMLARKMPIKDISEITGLSKSVIKTITL